MNSTMVFSGENDDDEDVLARKILLIFFIREMKGTLILFEIKILIK